jgi:A/G-specific adenine glycosylase
VLVSEFMLQQTQVATVVPYFTRFMKRFPTAGDLAAAEEQEVLRYWQGLGYYSRARNLHAAAQRIAGEFGGRVPRDVENLLSLPGIGRYTAGAIASIAFECRAPILDGNVARVLCRLEAIRSDPRAPATIKKLWETAEAMLPAKDCGSFNSALMELGATICVPRQPRCLLCPVREFCRAAATGVQNEIPPPRKTRETPLHQRWTICVQCGDHWLLERRPKRGRWAGLWQFPTIHAKKFAANGTEIGKIIGVKIRGLRSLGEIRHALTHRRYVFNAFTAVASDMPKREDRQWIMLKELPRFPLSRPQLRIAELLEKPTTSRR